MPLRFGKKTPDEYAALKSEFGEENDVPVGRYNAKMERWYHYEKETAEGEETGTFFLTLKVTEDMEDPAVHGAKLGMSFGYDMKAFSADPNAKKGGGAQTRIAEVTMKETIAAANSEVLIGEDGKTDSVATLKHLAEVVKPVINVKVTDDGEYKNVGDPKAVA